MLAVSGYDRAMWWWVWRCLVRTRVQYAGGAIRFCAVGVVIGWGRSNVSSVGIGSVSRAVRDA